MLNPSPEYSPSRPFKIFISLLDKYEVGSPLTEALVFDSFRALKRGIEKGSDPGDEVRTYHPWYLVVSYKPLEQLQMTASTLYEAVEPLALYKQLLAAVLSDITADADRSEVRIWRSLKT